MSRLGAGGDLLDRDAGADQGSQRGTVVQDWIGLRLAAPNGATVPVRPACASGPAAAYAAPTDRRIGIERTAGDAAERHDDSSGQRAAPLLQRTVTVTGTRPKCAGAHGTTARRPS